jgi:putative tributyrin esterase
MSLVRFNFESQYLGNNHEIGIILPDKQRNKTPKEFYSSGEKYPVLWLLHGTFGDYSDWIRKSNIELYACEQNLIVVMPSAMNSDYVNWPDFGIGYNMWDYLTEELMPLVYNWFPASDKREDNFIAGLSMGGGGALKYALGHPEKFGAAAILSSSAREISYLQPYANLSAEEFRAKAIKGEINIPTPFPGGIPMRQINSISKYPTVGDYLDSVENTWDMLAKLAPTGKLPKMYVACGTDDFAYKGFLKFKDYAKELGLEAEFEEMEGYKHEWRFWDITIQHAIKFFGLGRDENAGNPF